MNSAYVPVNGLACPPSNLALSGLRRLAFATDDSRLQARADKVGMPVIRGFDEPQPRLGRPWGARYLACFPLRYGPMP